MRCLNRVKQRERKEKRIIWVSGSRLRGLRRIRVFVANVTGRSSLDRSFLIISTSAFLDGQFFFIFIGCDVVCAIKYNLPSVFGFLPKRSVMSIVLGTIKFGTYI